MAITSAIATSFKVEILKAVHNFTNSTGNTFKVALIKANASQTGTYGAATTSYTTVTGNSGFGIKASSRATATKAVRPIAMIDEPGNALTGTDGAFPKLEVKIVQHWMKRQATA